MKQLVLSVLLMVLLTNIICGQEYVFPDFTNRQEKDLTITQVIREANLTKIYFKFQSSNPNSSYILLYPPNSQGAYFIKADNKIYRLLSTTGIGNTDRVTAVYPNYPVYFSGTFEAIPKSIIQFDLIEGSNGTWNFYGVKLKTSSSSKSTGSSSNSVLDIQPAVSINTNPNISEECDKINYTTVSTKPSIESFLKGVKYAMLPSPDVNGQVPMFTALSNYVFDMGLIIITSKGDLSKYDLSQVVFIEITNNHEYELGNNNKIYRKCSDIKIYFTSPKFGYEWVFSTAQTTRSISDQELTTQYYNCLRSAFNNTRYSYNSAYTLKSASRKTCWTESSIKQFFQLKGVDNIEGIYQASGSVDEKYRLALKKIRGIYYLIFLTGATNITDWNEGEIKAILESSATPLLFNAKWVMANKEDNSNCYITFEKGLMNVFVNNNRTNYIKLFPSVNDLVIAPSGISSSGSGFAITSNGLIVTNNHVIEGAKTIKIRGVNGNFNKTYLAKVIITDKNNDLSIIKIDDPSFSSLGSIPYIVKSSSANVGENVFVLGYPLRASMGDEIKLTNGIISSKSGFQGDITSYQITAAAQPGNSGGPLFNNNGNLIGIVNSKNTEAENASYAIKSSYLLNLINLLDNPPTMQKVSSIAGKPLTQQVQIVKKFVYIIEIN